MPSPTINRRIVLSGGGIVYDADAQIYFNTVATPLTAARKIIVNDLVTTLKADGNWTKIDVLGLLANENQDASVVNLVNPTSTKFLEVNSPGWDKDEGYTSDGTTSHVSTEYTPSIEGVNFTLNDCGLHVYSRSDISENKYMIGSTDNTLRTAIALYGKTTFYSPLNTSGLSTKVISDTLGLHSTQRTASDLTTVYKNGTSLGTHTDASGTLCALDIFICAISQGGPSANFWTTRQIAIAACTSGDITNSTFYTAIQTYMTAIGSQV